MTDQTKPRETFRDAFYAVLVAEFDGSTDPPIVEYNDPTNAQQHSIVLSMVSGSNKRPGFGRRTSATQSGMFERYRIQISVHNPNGFEAAEQEADRVEQAITGALHSPFRTVYDMHDIHKIVDSDQGPNEVGERMAHMILDYEGLIISDKTD
jgi:hypothetical protein